MALRIEGFAIISNDGMLAGADGMMPNSLKFEGDQCFLDEALDAAALLIHGRKSHEAQDNSHKRKRLLLTRSGGPFSTSPIEDNTWLWSPEATPFAQVCKALGVESGVVAVLGGTAAYDMFLPFYATFHLCRATKVELPQGVPVFGAVSVNHSVDAVLREHGLEIVDEFMRHEAEKVRHQTWARKAG